jgi:predicted phosphodiesterase
MGRTTNTLPSDTARKYLESKRFRNYPRLKQARILYNENPLLWKNADAARTTLKYLAGKLGVKGRKSLGRFDDLVEEKNRPYNPYNLPSSDETAYEPYIIKGHKRIGILSDIHIPYHSISSLTLAITYLKKQKIDALLLNGDTLDCHKLSKYSKDPKKRDFKGELDTFKTVFEVFEKQFKCKIYFKIGNHDERYEKFLQEKAGELAGIEEFEFENIIKARARGIEVIGDQRVMKLNSLNGIHGHEYKGGISAPVNVARGLYLKGKVSAFQGHNHQSSTHTESDMNGKVTTTYSIACLSELHPAYMVLNKWNHGFAVVDLDPNGENFEFRNHTIYKGKVY